MSAPSEVCAVCQKPAPEGSRCSSCHLVSYCSREHQKQDWPRHKAACCAYEVKYSPETGPYVVAARNIQKDDVIVEEVPLVIGPNHNTGLPESCLGCFCEGPKEPCPICDWPICGAARCFGASETHLRLECLVLRQIKATAIYSLNTILPLRCLIIQHADPKKRKILEDFIHQAVALIGDLTDKSNQSRESEICFLESILKPLITNSPRLLSTCTPENVRKVYRMLDAFGLRLKLPWTGGLTAVCAVTSRMEHSCMPNSRRKLNIEPPTEEKPFRYKVIVRATKDIAKGERITTMFVDGMACTLMRQYRLKDSRNITCKCARCLDPTELGTNFGTVRCIKGDGWVLPINTSDIIDSDWKCVGKCKSVYPSVVVTGLISGMKVNLKAIDVSEEREDPKCYVRLLNEELHTLFHPNHFLCVDVKWRILTLQQTSQNMSLSDIHLRRIADYCGDIYNIMRHPCFETVETILEDSVLELHSALEEIVRRREVNGAGKILRSYQDEEEQKKLEELLNHAKELQDAKYDKMAWFRPNYTL